MANIPAVGFSQSTDGGTLTLIDETTYESPIGNYTRKVQLWTGINGSGTMLDEIDFVGSELEVEYAISADAYFSAKLIHTGSPSIATVYANFTTSQFEQNLINQRLNANCGCSQIKGCSNLVLGFIFKYETIDATTAGNSGLANSFISSAYNLLST